MATTGSLSNTTTTRTDGIRVDKGIEPGDNRVRVHYRIVSERADAAAVRIEESLGSGFPMDALDLDSGAGSCDWLHDAGSARIALVDIVDAGEEVTTGYVVRASDPARIEAVFDAPDIDMVDPLETDPDADGVPASGTSDSAARGMASIRDREAVTNGPSGGTAGAADADVAAAVDASAIADAIDPGAVAAALDPEALATHVDAEALAAHVDSETLAAHVDASAVVGELEPSAIADALDDDQLAALREAMAPERTRSDDLEFTQLRARLEDFAAYADGLEELIDEHGTATEIIDDLRADIDAAGDAVDALDRQLEDASAGHASPAARFDAIEDRLETVTDRLDTLVDRLDTHDAHLERVEDRHERLDARIGTVDGRVDGVADDVAETASSLQTFHGTCEESLTELATHVSEIETELADVDRWRDQVGQAFSASASEARAPDSIFRAEDGDEDAATDGGDTRGDGDGGDTRGDGDGGDDGSDDAGTEAAPAAADDDAYDIDGLDANADSTGAD